MKRSRVLEQDFERISKDCFPRKRIQRRSFLITGATGLIGSYLIKLLLFLNDRENLGIHIYGLVRNPQKAQEVYGDLTNNSAFKLLIGDITDDIEKLIEHSVKIDYIIHAASVTSSKTMIEKPVETARTSLLGSFKILNYAKNHGIESMVFISSMEMYGDTSFYHEIVDEEKVGIMDPLVVRNCYPESKRMVENLCVDYFSEYGVPIKIARLAQTFGAGVLPQDNRVFAQFAKSVINHEDIVLHTAGKSYGNYSYISDTILGILYILMFGENGNAYNVTNMANRTTIADMARLVADDIARGEINVRFDIPNENIYGYAKDTDLFLDSTKLQNLGLNPQVSLKESYIRLIDYFIENN